MRVADRPYAATSDAPSPASSPPRECSTRNIWRGPDRGARRRRAQRCPMRSPVGYSTATSPTPRTSGHEQRRARPWPACRGSPAMSLFVAAIGATVTAIVELTVGPYIRVGNAQPHLVFVFAVVWTIAIGLESGLVWAFVGGSPSTSWHNGRSEHRPSHSLSSSVSRRRSLAYSSGSGHSWSFRPSPYSASCTR